MIQLITLMDDLLRKENLDLKLMPYKVLATGADHGMVQFVQSMSLANVLNENNGSLLMYWRKYHLDERSVETFGVRPEVMDNYVKSCGMCIKETLYKFITPEFVCCCCLFHGTNSIFFSPLSCQLLHCISWI